MSARASSKTQGERAARALAQHGTSRRALRGSDGIASIGTERTTADALRNVATWMRTQGWCHGVDQIKAKQAYDYLRARAQVVTQNTLNKDRRALERVLGRKLERIESTLPRGRLATQQRHYTRDQIARVMAAQNERNAFSTLLASRCGLRAHELLTIARTQEMPQPERTGRHADTFAGRDGVMFSVRGKGGLVRHVLVPHDLAAALESRRLEVARVLIDRKLHQLQRYDLAGGQAWSQSFSAASKRALDWSVGGHAMRHGYADQRQRELTARGYSEHDAKSVIAQEVGHWNPRTTEAYLRRN